MGVFKDMLGSGQTLFKNPNALEYDFIPKLIPFREGEQREIVSAVMPLMQQRNGRNLFIYGTPGIGKTLAVRAVMREVEDETDEIIPLYVNCWNKNTTYKILTHLVEELGYPFTQNKRTEELFKILKERVNNASAVFVFDEIDKAEELDVLYLILEEIFRSSIIMITNHEEWIVHLDMRIKSRLTPDHLSFAPYSLEELRTILSERAEAAFYDGVIDPEQIGLIAQKTFTAKDVRTGLFLLRESGTYAESESKKTIEPEHVARAVAKIDEFKIKNIGDLDPDLQDVLSLIKEHDGERIGSLFEKHSKTADVSYKTFQRRIAKLEKGRYISVDHIEGGEGGRTSILHYNTSRR
jgi:archaeal cell division control protein 6